MPEPTNDRDRLQNEPSLPAEKQVPGQLTPPQPPAVGPRRWPGGPLFQGLVLIVAIVTASVTSIFAQEAIRAYGFLAIAIVGGGSLLLLAALTYSVRWLVRSLQAERLPPSFYAVEGVVGLLLALLFLVGSVGRDPVLRDLVLGGPDAWLGVLPHGYLGWPTAALHGLGVGLGFGLLVHGLLRACNRPGTLAATVTGAVAVLACAVAGPALSQARYQRWEEIAWQEMLRREGDFGAPVHHWEARYFNLLPERLHRAEAWGRAVRDHAAYDYHPTLVEEYRLHAVIEANRHADWPGVAAAKVLLLESIQRRVRAANQVSAASLLHTLQTERYRNDPDLRALADQLRSRLPGGQGNPK